MIGIIDYGMGNLGSVTNAFRFLELDAKIVTRNQELADCRALILPGVGAFGDCMAHLVEHDFVDAIEGWVQAGKPMMGICLGLQALFESSEESPGVEGLGIFAGTVKRFDLPKELKVPQIGWNRMEETQPDCPMFEGIDNGSFFYLVHSFYVCPQDESIVAGKTEYGIEYCTSVWKDNVFATQFHPEKSQAVGLCMLKNFWNWAEVQ
ncbi:Imidazole glycerol phosphate synthase subunit HisH [Pontiella desulfatans]|uniref:Imidazole glycerol phosphate synthase subunit HisH n=1 Tax=Pontiella desulfatans TaxID=2750659 RepID=A0A6C2U9R0_PONDE|nr:imidazole glycerol phosphate synthase subunit HisH [Pontiella desulfatans]VGO16828.1 Imidazole glycerol phosphate synthase subunit HisH [Pontiella desulfatans]